MMQMDSYTVNNDRNSHHQKSRKSSAFSQAVISKTDVGEFQDGYFVMADATKENQQQHNRNKNNHHKTERHSPERLKGDSPRSRSLQQRERSAKDFNNYVATEGDNAISHTRTSPSHSPSKSRRHSPNLQPIHSDNPTTVPPSPHKPRKAYQEKHVDRPEVQSDSGSPPKGSSPTHSRWAGPAFSNAPPPSSLPLPEFPPFAPLSASPSSSPSPISVPTAPISIPPPTYHEPYYYAQPFYSYHPPQYYPYTGPTLDQLSMDLRRMLHINEQQTVTPIRA